MRRMSEAELLLCADSVGMIGNRMEDMAGLFGSCRWSPILYPHWKDCFGHLKETFDYYIRLRVAEIEGDMLKAFVAKDADEARSEVHRLWVTAKAELAERERAVAG